MRDDQNLEAPENLGAPMPSFWAPGVRRALSRRARFGPDASSRFIIKSLVFWALLIALLWFFSHALH